MTSDQSQTPVVEHWFDLICPFCYIAQDRNRILREHGIQVIEHGIQIHPEIGPGGRQVGPRTGTMYDTLAGLAAEANLPLNWSDKIPYSRPALVTHEWLAVHDPHAAEQFAASVFDAYFGAGKDIEDETMLMDLAEQAGANTAALSAARPEAEKLFDTARARAAELGITATPAWVWNGRQISGLESRQWFERWADTITKATPVAPSE